MHIFPGIFYTTSHLCLQRRWPGVGLDQTSAQIRESVGRAVVTPLQVPEESRIRENAHSPPSLRHMGSETGLHFLMVYLCIKLLTARNVTAVKPAAVQKNTVKPAAIEINVRVYYNDYGNQRNNTEETRF